MVTSLPNVLYLTNFTGSSAVVVITADRLFFITDFRYVTAIEELQAGASACPGLELVTVADAYDETLASLLRARGAARVGLEAAHFTMARFSWLSATLRAAGPQGVAELVPTEGIVEASRLVKDEYELATLHEAGRRLSAVTLQAIAEVRAGRSEREIAAAIDARLREAGFDKPAFDTIVAGGPNAALPHARPGGRTLIEGDLVVLDFGGVYDSYCVDLTRTVAVGRAQRRAREVHAAVERAHDLAIAAVAPGVSRFAIDAVARRALEERGLGEAFGHGTGHGLGIEVHENPRIGRRRATDVVEDPVAAGMVFTIEPGAYLPGWGGVRIEDDVLVTRDGVERLTDAPTALVER